MHIYAYIRVGDVVAVAGKVASQAKAVRPAHEEPLCSIPHDIDVLTGSEVGLGAFVWFFFQRANVFQHARIHTYILHRSWMTEVMTGRTQIGVQWCLS